LLEETFKLRGYTPFNNLGIKVKGWKRLSN